MSEAGSAGRRGIVVVGGAGFIGSHLVDALLAAGETVDVIDTLQSGALANLAAARRAGGSLKFDHLDAASGDGAAVLALRRPRVVYHLALLPPGTGSDRSSSTAAYASIVAVCEASRQAGVDKVVVAVPAVDIYGRPGARALPVKEIELVANGLRGVAAKAALDVLSHFRDAHGLEFTALAMANVYGPRQRADGGVVAAFVAAAVAGRPATVHGDGRQTRDLLYVDDAVEALVAAAERGGGLVVNVGTGVQTSIRDLRALVDPDGAVDAAPARRAEIGRFAVSPVRARIHLAWSPWTSVADGVAETLAAARAGTERSGEHGAGEGGGHLR